MTDPTDASKMIVAYNPGDFFYSTASNPPTNTRCDTLFLVDAAIPIPCDSNFMDNSSNCIDRELCKNNAIVKRMYGQNESKWKTDELNYDTLAIYRMEYLFMWNLGIAIAGLLIAIYMLYPTAGFTKVWNNTVNAITKRLPQMSNKDTGAAAGTGTINNKTETEEPPVVPPPAATKSKK